MLTYNPAARMPTRFASLVLEGVRTTPTKQHTANLCEKFGNGLLYIQENAPDKVVKLCTNPQAITFSVFAAAHLVNSYTFYPQLTTEAIEWVVSCIPEISGEAVRFSAWLATSVTITGLCARAGGRLTESYIQSLIPEGEEVLMPQAGGALQ